MNHYAAKMFFDKAGRHYWFARELKKRGYEPTVFAAATVYNDELVDVGNKKSAIKENDSIPFVFVKTNKSIGNGFSRIWSWISFYRNLFSVTRGYAKERGKPDVIIASSVHPLTMIAGIKIARRYHVPCICEIRDLWPEAIFQFGKAKENSIIGRTLIKGEHWIYKNANALIFTKEGDIDYLKEKGWLSYQGGDIDPNKCNYINNGVDIEAFDRRIETEIYNDIDLSDTNKFNVIYTGTIRPVNNVGNILDAAKIVKTKAGCDNIQFLIFGNGEQLEILKNRVIEEKITNVKFKGEVQRKYIPFILSRSSVNIMNYSQGQYNWTRGNSSNKLFEYMASGKPIISTVHMNYSIIKKYNCGSELNEDSPVALAQEIMRYYDMSQEERTQIGANAKNGAKDFDFGILTDKLINAIRYVQ